LAEKQNKNYCNLFKMTGYPNCLKERIKNLIDLDFEGVFSVTSLDAMTCKNEAADRVVLPNAGGPVVLQVAVPARTQKSVTQNLAGRSNSRTQHRQAGVGRLHQL
jgi:hypothetical protein